MPLAPHLVPLLAPCRLLRAWAPCGLGVCPWGLSGCRGRGAVRGGGQCGGQATLRQAPAGWGTRREGECLWVQPQAPRWSGDSMSGGAMIVIPPPVQAAGLPDRGAARGEVRAQREAGVASGAGHPGAETHPAASLAQGTAFSPPSPPGRSPPPSAGHPASTLTSRARAGRRTRAPGLRRLYGGISPLWAPLGLVAGAQLPLGLWEPGPGGGHGVTRGAEAAVRPVTALAVPKRPRPSRTHS